MGFLKTSWLLGALLNAAGAIAAVSNDTDYFQSSDLVNTTASAACQKALVINVTCYRDLLAAITRTTSWSLDALSQICDDAYTTSLNSWVSSENWVSAANAGASSDAEYELKHRRQLVEKWASATQEFRDSYQSRAPVSLPGTEGSRSRGEQIEGLRYPAEALERIYDTLQPDNTSGLICIAPVDENHPENRARLVKFAILLYDYDIEAGHCIDSHIPSEANLNPATTNDSSVEDFLPWADLETANFLSIYLTHTGTVIYFGCLGIYMLVDELGLQTGRLTFVEYEINGTVQESVEIRPFNMKSPNLRAHHCGSRGRPEDIRLDMDLPIVDILCQAKEVDKLSNTMFLCDREQWTSDVELYAPGYLALEAEGRGGKYPLTRLADPNTITGIKKQVMIAVEDPNFSHARFTWLAPRRP
ncbi:uncharacterized protein N7503_009140 [Penicillium pulvis]|uniref:uncharacterized protein n=1 Tax=Penicillium pulvis TaxID=1562058 RepID=UPI002546EA26|nr:uncharacterized protein N7503_009140 [Penicillium pulvis]KAJ5793162.1 hypothetical protein N7503_009140 [Penicillium pulvis]